MRSHALLAGLALTACTTDGSQLLVDQAPPPLVLDATNPIVGGTMTFTASGGLQGERVYIARSIQGTGSGPCLPQLNNQCLGIVNPVLQTNLRLDASGEGSVTQNLPNVPAIDGAIVCFQAGLPRTTGSLVSNVVCVEGGYDTDGDGIIDALDLCPTGPNDRDWDDDGTPDACDDPADRPPEFTTAEFSPALSVTTFQNRTLVSRIPSNPAGLVMFFHGSGGASDTLMENPEMVVVGNAMLDEGFGVAAISSQATNGVFDDASPAGSNSDWQRVDDLRDALIASGDITSSTPIFAVGYSAGGAFSSWLGHVAPGQGWPLKAVAYHNSVGRSDLFAAAPGLPSIFLGADNDTRVDDATVLQRATEHTNAGFSGFYLQIEEERLAPTRFARSSFINQTRSEELWQELVDRGYWDAQGYRLFPASQIDATVDTIRNSAWFTPSAPGKSMLNAVLATHQPNGQHAAAEAAFFWQNR